MTTPGDDKTAAAPRGRLAREVAAWKERQRAAQRKDWEARQAAARKAERERAYLAKRTPLVMPQFGTLEETAQVTEEQMRLLRAWSEAKERRLEAEREEQNLRQQAGWEE